MGVSAAIGLLLVLDLSGSMDQVIDGQTKSQQMKDQARAVLSTIPNEVAVQSVFFGTEPVKACLDIKVSRELAPKAISSLKAVNPGVNGKTPLARTLRMMGDWTKAAADAPAILITDGADTCGEDACAALDELGKILDRENRKLSLIVIGYDLKSDEKKLECFKKPHGKNLTLQFFSAKKPWDVQKALGQLMAEASSRRAQSGKGKTGLGEKGGGKNSKGPGEQANGSGAQGAAGAGAGAAGALADPRFGPGILLVTGAEAKDRFVILQDHKVIREWFGGLPTELPVGDYTVKYDHPNGKEVSFAMKNKDRRDFVLSDFMIKSKSDVRLENSGLGFEAVPAGRTTMMHRKVEPVHLTTNFEGTPVGLDQVPLGQWTLKVEVPSWMKGRLPDQTLMVDADKSTFAADQAFQKSLKWIDNDQPEKQRVLEIRFDAGRVETHLIPPGAKRLPLFQTDRAHWLR